MIVMMLHTCDNKDDNVDDYEGDLGGFIYANDNKRYIVFNLINDLKNTNFFSLVLALKYLKELWMSIQSSIVVISPLKKKTKMKPGLDV